MSHATAITQQSKNGDDDETIKGWTINRKQSTVNLIIQGKDAREVPEEEIQREDEAKVLNFWASFNQARERTIKCNTFRIFKILDHKPGKLPQLLIHWVGYEGNAATWEPVSNMLESSDATKVHDYLCHQKLNKRLRPATDTSPDATPSSAAPSSSKRHRRDSGNPPPKRNRKSTTCATKLGLKPRTRQFIANTTIGSDLSPPADPHIPQTSDTIANVELAHPDSRRRLVRASSAPVETATKDVCRSRGYSLGSGANKKVVTDRPSPTFWTNRPLASPGIGTSGVGRDVTSEHTRPSSRIASRGATSRLPWQLLTADDMADLVSREGRLNDNHINALFTMGAALSPSFVTVDSCLTTIEASKRIAKTSTSHQIWCGKSTKNRKIMCPLHLENHWVLLVLELGTKCATLYDSLEDPTSPIPKRLFNHIRGLIQHQLPVHPHQSPSEWSIKRAFCPRQESSHDCGIYVIVLMFFLVAEKSSPAQVNAFIWRHILKHLCSSANGNCTHATIGPALLGYADLSPFGATPSKDIITENTNKPIDDLMAKIKTVQKLYNRLERIGKEIEDLQEALLIFSLLRDRRDSLLSQVHVCSIQLQDTINEREKAHRSLQNLHTLGAWTEDELKEYETVMRGLRQSAKNNKRWNDAIIDTYERFDCCDSEIKSVFRSFADERERLVGQMQDWGQEALDHFITTLRDS